MVCVNSPLSILPAGQFRIFRNSAVYAQGEPSGDAERFEFGGFCLEWAPPLRVTFLKGGDGDLIGVVLGHAFVVDTGERLSSQHFVGATASTYTSEAFEGLYEGLFGSFIVIISIQGRFYAYLDADACRSSVYSRELDIFGATTSAILSPKDYESRLRWDLYKLLDLPNEGWFPSGFTAHRGVSRLLCNHRLDLDAMTATRHWPSAAPQRAAEGQEVVDRLGSALRANLNVILDNFRAAIALTGGGDCRTLLSLMRDRSDEVNSYLFVDGSPKHQRELYLGSRLAKLSGLRFQTLRLPPYDEESARRWHYNVGHTKGGLFPRLYRTLEALGDRDAIIEGFGAEAARCFFWKSSDTEATTLTGAEIYRRFGMPRCDELIEATEQWFSGVPKGDVFFTLDLAYLELRSGPWVFADAYVDPWLAHLNPFISRRTFTELFRLPLAVKRADGFRRNLIRSHWPELDTIPINKYGDLRDMVFKTRRAIAEPYLVTKKLRKMLAR